jgi:hypothetical protein
MPHPSTIYSAEIICLYRYSMRAEKLAVEHPIQNTALDAGVHSGSPLLPKIIRRSIRSVTRWLIPALTVSSLDHFALRSRFIYSAGVVRTAFPEGLMDIEIYIQEV